MSNQTDLRKLAGRSRAELFLLLESTLLLGLMRAAILLFRFQAIARWLGLGIAEPSSQPVSEEQIKRSKQIGWAVRAAAPRTLWQSACLAQALTCASMLRRRHIPALLYLGVARGITNSMEYSAHAWLGCAENILVGAAGHERFQIVATFSTAPAKK